LSKNEYASLVAQAKPVRIDVLPPWKNRNLLIQRTSNAR
jgi:hypothetical protein